eukprot:CAMPEP_0178412678 /NCGR_PEP_ID=MMETSP0689_2-20121128/22140_1 /TAXON_ID=160604 /ORGANISM="Amphidinium massartii, Strain CS-259" /LENGTH=170 /DNA_ID=CAMNT_0020033935 /DNA_START=407 /DNA_END=919 /DNA_ORIENTATION=+
MKGNRSGDASMKIAPSACFVCSSSSVSKPPFCLTTLVNTLNFFPPTSKATTSCCSTWDGLVLAPDAWEPLAVLLLWLLLAVLGAVAVAAFAGNAFKADFPFESGGGVDALVCAASLTFAGDEAGFWTSFGSESFTAGVEVFGFKEDCGFASGASALPVRTTRGLLASCSD